MILCQCIFSEAFSSLSTLRFGKQTVLLDKLLEQRRHNLLQNLTFDRKERHLAVVSSLLAITRLVALDNVYHFERPRQVSCCKRDIEICWGGGGGGGDTITAAHFFSKRLGIPSHPVAFCGSVNPKWTVQFQQRLGKRQVDTLARWFHSVGLPGQGGQGAKDQQATREKHRLFRTY